MSSTYRNRFASVANKRRVAPPPPSSTVITHRNRNTRPSPSLLATHRSREHKKSPATHQPPTSAPPQQERSQPATQHTAALRRRRINHRHHERSKKSDQTTKTKAQLRGEKIYRYPRDLLTHFRATTRREMLAGWFAWWVRCGSSPGPTFPPRSVGIPTTSERDNLTDRQREKVSLSLSFGLAAGLQTKQPTTTDRHL